MLASAGRQLEVFRIHPATFWGSVLVSLLLQILLPVRIPLARLMDFPLLVTIYFSLLRRNKVFGIALGTGVGLLQDALAHGYIGFFGIVKTLVGYLAASASLEFDLESQLTRAVLTAVFVLMHSLGLAGLQRVLLESPPPFQPLQIASVLMVNVALGLLLFLLLDRFRRPA
jgi:rod shape-determining protein MreD